MKNKNEEKENYSNEKYKLSSIFYFIVGLIITLVFSYKILVNEIDINIKNVDYVTLLSFILAFFSIVLSMMFYFKSNDSSNKFYDNTYKFTKDISIILGRIEAGFGEKLQNLDKNYSGLSSKIETNNKSVTVGEVEETKSDKNEIQKNLATEYKERNEIISNLIEKATIDSQEKESIKNNLREKEKTILELSKNLESLQKRLRFQENNYLFNDIPSRLIEWIKRKIIKLENYQELPKYGTLRLSEQIKKIIPDPQSMVYHDLLKSGLINENGDLTIKGSRIIREITRTIL